MSGGTAASNLEAFIRRLQHVWCRHHWWPFMLRRTARRTTGPHWALFSTQRRCVANSVRCQRPAVSRPPTGIPGDVDSSAPILRARTPRCLHTRNRARVLRCGAACAHSTCRVRAQLATTHHTSSRMMRCKLCPYTGCDCRAQAPPPAAQPVPHCGLAGSGAYAVLLCMHRRCRHRRQRHLRLRPHSPPPRRPHAPRRLPLQRPGRSTPNWGLRSLA